MEEIKFRNEIPVESQLNSPVVNFYTGRSVFITGCTGFLGTVLLEKLLFTCGHNIKNIYILIKQKDDQRIDEKVKNFFNSRAFQRLNEYNPNFRAKIKPISGDISKKYIGVNENDLSLLRKEISIVFHSAADTSFDMSLNDAVNINTKATEELLKICKDMHQLKAFVYVSTAYSNCNRSVIDEKVYRCDVPLETQYEVLEYCKSERLTQYLLDGRPNAYSYSKALSEELIQNYSNAVPSIIIRPSIITSAVKDPIPGWLSGWNGLNQVIYAGMSGNIKCWYANPLCISDTIPVDYTANIMIVSAWEAGARLRSKNQLKVYNCCSGLQNPINNETIVSICMEYNVEYEKDKSKINKLFIIRNNFYIHMILFVFLHIIPALVIDVFYFLSRRKLVMLKSLKKIRRLSEMLKIFCLQEFLFINNNVRMLYESLDESDKILFNFDVKSIQWKEYLKNYVIGMKEYSKVKKRNKVE